MNCNRCGNPMREDDQFCTRCGAPRAIPGTCPACGRSNPPDAAFCGACGVSLATPPAPSAVPPPGDSSEAPSGMLTARAQQWRRFFGKLDLLFHPQGLLEKGLEADLAGRRPEGEALEEAGFPLPDDSPTEPWILCWPLKLGGRPFVLRSLKFRDRAHSRFVIDCRGHSKLCMTGRRVGVVRHKEGWAMPPNVEVFAVPLTEVAGTDVSRSTLRIHSQADSRIAPWRRCPERPPRSGHPRTQRGGSWLRLLPAVPTPHHPAVRMTAVLRKPWACSAPTCAWAPSERSTTLGVEPRPVLPSVRGTD